MGYLFTSGSRPAESNPLAEELHELVDACLLGDEAAMRRFVERYQGRVFALCWRMLQHRQDAEDAAQETFVRALRSLSQWDRSRPLEPWLLTVAANRCRSALARRQRRPPGLPLQDDDAPQYRDELQAARILTEEIHRSLDRMRAEYAQAFRLFHEEELSYTEIAEVFDCPLGTVKTWVHRARREILAHLTRRGVIELTNHAVRPNRATTQRAAG